MASSRSPGPVNGNRPGKVDDGTSCRQASHCPGIISNQAPGATPQVRNRGAKRSVPPIPILQQGSNGLLVAKLQKLLNSRLQPSPNLKIDGFFGARTRAAVVQYQKSRSANADGIVGRQTWPYLMATTKIMVETPANAAMPQQSTMSLSKHPQVDTVSDWTLEQKFTEMVGMVPKKLTKEIKAQFLGLVQPSSLALGLVIFAVSYLFGVGELLTIGLLLIIGEQALIELIDAVQTTSMAASERELDEGAEHLARAISIVGVAAFVAWLSRFLPRTKGARKTGESAPVADELPTKTLEPKEQIAAPELPPLRKQYVEAVEALNQKVARMRAQGATNEQIARTLHAERRALGVQFKELTPPEKLGEIYQRNLEKYGDKLGPTIEWLRQRGKTWDQIIESATRPGGKDLGF